MKHYDSELKYGDACVSNIDMKLSISSVVLEAQVAVAPDHPSTVPVVALALRWEGLHHADDIPQLRVSTS